MIKSNDVKTLGIGQSLTDNIQIGTVDGSKYIQRVRNYAQQHKDESRDFTVNAENGIITISCVTALNKKVSTIVDGLRDMEPGDVLHLDPMPRQINIKAITLAVGGEFEISTATKVKKVK